MNPAIVPRPSGDEAARQRIRTSLNESLLVEASAGTGKTSELVRRIVMVLGSGATTVGRIAAVTFTNKAAGELKLRLRNGLDRERAHATGDRLTHLENALAHLEEASIGTIHSFCGQLLRERPVEAVVDPAFQELTDTQSAALFDRAFSAWFQQRLAQPSPGLRRALTRLAWPQDWESSSPIDQLKWAGRSLLEWRDFQRAWARPDLDRQAIIDRMVDDLRDRVPRLRGRHLEIRELLEWIERAEAIAPRDYDTLEARFLKLLRDVRRHQKSLGDLVPLLEEFQKVVDIDLAAELRSEMMELVELYEKQKVQTGRLDFLDLLLLSRDLVKKDRMVRTYLQGRFTHLFIDEFQDTDPLQAELLLLLSADNPDETDWRKVTPQSGKLFVVGDPKQSIYKFRRADMSLYQQIRRDLLDKGVGLVRLSRSFRSVRPIQDCVNAAFEPVMVDNIESGQIGYSALEPVAEAIDGQPSVIALPVPQPYSMSGRVTKGAINESLPGAITGFVQWLVRDSGWLVREGESLVPVAPRHICILFRRRSNGREDVTREYTRGLEARGIPHLLAGSKSYHERDEIETIRTALQAIEWPSDELSVFATLRGPLFAIDDATLLRFQHKHGRFHPFTRRPDEDAEAARFAPVWQALDLLGDLHRKRNWRAIADTIHLLLEATRAQAVFGLRPGGHQSVANVYRLADMGRSFELEGGISFRGCVEMLIDKAERGETSEAPVMEEGSEGVRLMTVHAAKGLEFPVVILADITARISAAEPDRHIDPERNLCATRLLRCMPFELMENLDVERRREEAEGVRIAYVAATRARDLLVVPAVGDGAQDGWVSPLNRALYPANGTWRHPRRAPGCPAFGQRTVVGAPMMHPHQDEPSIKPGLHRPAEGPHEVVWWDPESLDIETEIGHALDQEILAEDGGTSLSTYEQWRSRREHLVAEGSVASLSVFTASQAPDAPPVAIPVQTITAAMADGRPRGARFGTLVHTILRDAAGGRIDELAQLHGKLLGSPEEEVASAVAAVQAALQHPLLREAFAAERCHRELPVVLREQGRVFEGIIDCAYLHQGVWTVLDYKTDTVPSLPPAYQTQIQWYAYALQKLTGGEVKAVLVRL